MIFSKKWSETDPDIGQFGRQLDCYTFEFYTTGKDELVDGVFPINWEYTYNTPEDACQIYIPDYSVEEVESCIQAYGYTLYESEKYSTNIYEIYGEISWWIIAECLYEEKYEI